MTPTGYSNAIVNVMLGWLKGLANWVLKLFNLAGSGGNPLLWLSENWLKLLILLLVVGMAVDWLVWMIRWRPYWVWMRKKRIIVNDERFLAGEEFDEEFEDGASGKQYVVPSAVVQHNSRRPAAVTPRRTAGAKAPDVPRRRRTNAVVTARRPNVASARRPVRGGETPERRKHQGDVFADNLFEVNRELEDSSDFYEDEVFNVSNLPDAQDYDRHGRKRRKA